MSAAHTIVAQSGTAEMVQLPPEQVPNETPASIAEASQQTAKMSTFEMRDAQAIGVAILAILAIIFCLYFGRDIVLPIVMAIVLNLLLQPLIRVMNVQLRLPMPIAALFVIVAVFVAIVAIAYAVSLATRGVSEHAAESFEVLRQKLRFMAQPLSYLQDALHSIENLGSAPGAPGTAGAAPVDGNALPKMLLFGTASSLRDFFKTTVILYFLLASGDSLLRAFIEVLPTFADKRRAVEIAGEIQSSIGSYLSTVTSMNAAVAVATGAGMWACGLGNPALWGVTAFLLNYVPIIGPLIGVVVFVAAGTASLAWPFPALAPPLIYGAIHLVEGQVLTPMLLAKRFELNPVLIILSLFFWDFIWGVPGALLAVPLLAIFKIVADRIDPLKPLGHLIGA